MTEDQLYQQYLAGDAAAGDTLMLRCGDALTAYLDAFVHNPEDAEDLMLDCFTIILVNKPVIEDGHFRPYLFRMARNKANRLWKLRFRRQEFSLDESLVSSDDSPEDAIQKSERSRILHKCLNRNTGKPSFLFMTQTCGMLRLQKRLAAGQKRLRIC